MQCCYDLKETCTATCVAYTQVSTMDGPDSVKIICLRLLREHQSFTPADKTTGDVDVAGGEPTPPPVQSPALVEIYR